MVETPVDEYMSLMEEVFRNFGLKSTHARIFSILSGHTSDISLDDLARESGYSLASVSGAIRFLEMTGHVHRFRKPGSKKVFVKAEHNFVSLLRKQLVIGQQTFVNPMLSRLPLFIKNQKKLVSTKLSKTRKEEEKELLSMFEQQYADIRVLDTVYAKTLQHLDKVAGQK